MILDIVIILIIALAGFFGYKKGLISILASLLSIIIAIILAIVLQNPVADYLMNDTGLGENIYNKVENTILEASESQNKEEGKSSFIVNFIKEDLVKENVESISNNVTKFIFKGISFIAVFIITLIIMYIISMILNLVFELPILNSINKIGGLIGGVIKGLISIFLIFAIIKFLEPIGFVTPVTNYINSSIISKYLYDMNLIVLLIKGNLKF